jgi:hypothetical protein
MTKKVYYIQNSVELDVSLELIKMSIPCFITREYIEMDYSEVEIIARNEDLACVERNLAWAV